MTDLDALAADWTRRAEDDRAAQERLQAAVEKTGKAYEAMTQPWRCETCRHWLVRGDRDKYDRPNPPDGAEWGECTNVDDANETNDAPQCAGSLMFLSAAYLDWNSEMVTHRSFGCVQWEAKR